MRETFVVFHMEDNNGHRSQFRLRAGPASVDSAGGVSFIGAAVAALGEFSSARIDTIEVRHEYRREGSTGTPGLESDIYLRLLLFFRNEGSAGSISIPSPRANLPFDEDGPYRLTRLTREGLLLSGMLGDLQGIIQGTLLPDGSPFPDTFYVGTLGRNAV